MVRILVTGGAGFLGSALANALVHQGHEVLVLDDLSAGDQTRLDSRVFFHRGEITNRPKLWTLLQGVQCVYHLAARVLVAESLLYPREYNEVNVGGTVALLEAMRDVGVPRLVFTSSGAIYGVQSTQPLSETLPPHPQSPYAVSKLAAEYYVHTIGALWGTTTVVLRIFNAYGPGQPLLPSHSPVVPRFIYQALGGGSLVIFGNGEQTRDFVYVDDVVRALIAAATAPDVNRCTINIGSGEETSILTLARHVLALTGSSSNIIYSPVEGGGVTRMIADLSLARRLLGYEPQVSLKEGLRRTLAEDPRFKK
ncbi:MAG TPA: NAD-dependent epimerase/dehydratase family protein [Anaerolineae bacterium]|nr:NAD-dependent epimerase/dehydratase family protein [Anaerolineae bacterium]HQK13371.1 NAD-dependent epimerase/dehydratase family protein [Anaerolineae bacterium]